MEQTAQPKLIYPSGRSTLLRFEAGVPSELIRISVTELLWSKRALRKPRARWVAKLGSFFMQESAPVLALSLDVPRELVDIIEATFEMFPFTVRKENLASLAFRNHTLLWIQEDFEKVFPPAP